METQHVEFTGEDTTMTDDDTTPTPTPAAKAIPFVRPEYPIVIKTISRGEGNAILRHVINNDTARLSKLLEDLAARDRTIPGKILVQAHDAFGRNAIHVALLLEDNETMEMLTFLLHNSILPAVYPALKRTLLNQVTFPAHGGDNPPLYACRLAKSIEVVRKLMAAGGALLGGVRNELGLDGLQCVVGPTVYGVLDVRESGDAWAGARLVRGLVEGGMFRVGRGVVYGQWAGDREVHLAARCNRVEELSTIVKMFGASCLEVENDEQMLPFEIAMGCESWGVASYIDSVFTNMEQPKGTR